MNIFENYNLNRPAWLLPHRADEPPIEGLRDLLQRLMQGRNLTRDESRFLLDQLLRGEATDAQIAAALVALSIKGETTEELAGMAEAMRSNATKIDCVHESFVDTAGTGSSRVKTFNVSTAAAFVIAGAGLAVAKHGSRAATSKSGSADVLTELGVNVSASREVSEQNLNEIGICFMFAPLYHASTKRVAAVRRELGVHTTFNLLGPMTNPAGAPFQVMGVWHKDLVAPIAETLQKLGTKHALVVHGLDGLDEITATANSSVAEVTPEFVKFREVSPEDFGFETAANIDELRGGDASGNAVIIREVLENKLTDAARSLVVMNAAAALFVGGRADDFKSAARLALESLESGAALEKLERLKELTN